MSLSEMQFIRLFPGAARQAGVLVPALNKAMACFAIDTAERQAAFLAQTGHECGGFSLLLENLAYSAQRLAVVWPRRFRSADGSPTALAREIAYQPERIANIVYAGRNGNGDEASGDGWRYRGRGALQITGRLNYGAVAKGLGQCFLENPQLLAEPFWACQSGAWWWRQHGLNELADDGRFADITRRINGGLNGLEQRTQLWRRAQAILQERMALAL
ncbi:glycoside hydrolase family 19 protein [Pseudomonas sp. NY15181]|uniref:glycoside hydrolase family 19 protein n=1 Tax=Pseudomonas sp. NY15181 TaxID=3400349 RepID=UPI003A87939A